MGQIIRNLVTSTQKATNIFYRWKRKKSTLVAIIF